MESAVLEDDEGMSAIEYALCSDAELRTVRLLQKATRRIMSRKHERMKHESAKLVSAMKSGKDLAPRKGILVEFPRKGPKYARSA
jgi:hypothetical protein